MKYEISFIAVEPLRPRASLGDDLGRSLRFVEWAARLGIIFNREIWDTDYATVATTTLERYRERIEPHL